MKYYVSALVLLSLVVVGCNSNASEEETPAPTTTTEGAPTAPTGPKEPGKSAGANAPAAANQQAAGMPPGANRDHP